MPQYNDMFELTVEDVDLIETALRSTKDSLSNDMNSSTDESTKKTVKQIQDLLGRLHNQKVFYRPKGGIYVGG